MFSITVNGEARSVDVDDDTPLLWVVRDELNLTGTKFGCGMAQCGACTVYLDGQPVRSCVTPVTAADGRAVTTIEGIDGKAATAVATAWAELDVPQSGYCQSGQIMAASALLETNSAPSDADIDTAMNGNVCRCASYVRIRRGIHRAAELMQA